MTWIKVIDVSEAEAPLREAYDEVASARGEVGNILKAHSLHPKVLCSPPSLPRINVWSF
jgi:hypothetical protein